MNSNDELLSAVGKAIRDLRKAQKISQLDLSCMVGMGSHHLCDLENGKINVGILNLSKICDALNISLVDFFTYLSTNQ